MRELNPRKKAYLIARINVDLLNDVVEFRSVFPAIYDILEYADVPTLQNALPVFYTLYQAWQPDSNDADNLSLLKREFLKVPQVKYWPSLTMLHSAATFLDPSLKHFRFVTDMNDRDGFFGQVQEAIVSLSKEQSTTDVPQSSASVTHDNSTTADAGDIPPTKKQEVSPFDWFQSASVPTGVSSASTATASVASLKERVLREIEVMRLKRYCVMLKVMFLILSACGGSMDKCIPYCLIVRVNYSLFQHRLQNANDISVLLIPGTSSHLSGT